VRIGSICHINSAASPRRVLLRSLRRRQGTKINWAGLALTTRDIARSELLRSALWQRVRTFMTTRDLLVLPTVAVPPFPVAQPIRPKSTANRATTIPVVLPNVWITLTRRPRSGYPVASRGADCLGSRSSGRRRQEPSLCEPPPASPGGKERPDPPGVTGGRHGCVPLLGAKKGRCANVSHRRTGYPRIHTNSQTRVRKQIIGHRIAWGCPGKGRPS
jgi:hypothetical protein